MKNIFGQILIKTIRLTLRVIPTNKSLYIIKNITIKFPWLQNKLRGLYHKAINNSYPAPKTLKTTLTKSEEDIFFALQKMIKQEAE